MLHLDKSWLPALKKKIEAQVEEQAPADLKPNRKRAPRGSIPKGSFIVELRQDKHGGYTGEVIMSAIEPEAEAEKGTWTFMGIRFDTKTERDFYKQGYEEGFRDGRQKEPSLNRIREIL